jgi:hypothetical protein
MEARMSFTNQASGVCFYCGNQINRNTQSHIYAEIRHHYKAGDFRDSGRNFHVSCFDKFEQNGRPINPHTEYEVLEHKLVTPEKKSVAAGS